MSGRPVPPGSRAALGGLAVAAALLLAILVPPTEAARGDAHGGPKPKPSPTGSAFLEGLDVSQWQGTIDWGRVAAAGKRFAMIRASAGSLTQDTTYSANRTGAEGAGLAVAAYHYANPDSTPNDALNEANWFLQLSTPQSGELIPALDVEVTNGLSVSDMQAWVGTWLTRSAVPWA